MSTNDEDWIAEAGRRGWAALTKNKKIRYVTKEREAVAAFRVPLFALTSGNLTIPQMAGALLLAMPRIHEACADDSGGSIWIVGRDGAVRRWWP